MKNETLIKSTLWSAAGEIMAKMFVPVSNMILARLIAPEIFGIIAAINAVISFADIVSAAGMPKYIVHVNVATKEEIDKISNTALCLNILVSFVFLALIFLMRYRICAILGNEGHEIDLFMACTIIPITAFSAVQQAYLQRNMLFKKLFQIRFVGMIIPFVVTIPLAICGIKQWSLIIGMIVSEVTKSVYASIKSDLHIELFLDLKCLKMMWSFCAFTLLSSATIWGTSNIDLFILGNKLGQYYTGVYKNVQNTVTGIMSLITASTTSVLYVALSRSQNNREEFNRIYSMYQIMISIMVLPMGVGTYLYRTYIIKLILGNQWIDGSDFLGMWCITIALVCTYCDISREAYKSVGKPKVSFYVELVLLLIIIPVCIWGVKDGFTLFCKVRCLVGVIPVFFHMFCMKKLFGMRYITFLKNTYGPIISCGMMMIFFVLFKSFLLHYPIVGIPLCAVIYVASLCVFKKYRSYLRFIMIKINARSARINNGG